MDFGQKIIAESARTLKIIIGGEVKILYVLMGFG